MNNRINYKLILRDKTIQNIYLKINKKINYVIDHGKLHVEHVIKNTKNICKALSISKHNKRLALIAAALHDVGRLYDNNGHGFEGAKFAKNYLNGKLSNEDIFIVCDAIAHHSTEDFDFNSSNDVAWVLLMADKMDNVRSRYIKKLINEKNKSKISYFIKKIVLKKVKDKITVKVYVYKKDIVNDEKLQKTFALYKTIIDHFGKESLFKIVKV